MWINPNYRETAFPRECLTNCGENGSGLPKSIPLLGYADENKDVLLD